MCVPNGIKLFCAIVFAVGVASGVPFVTQEEGDEGADFPDVQTSGEVTVNRWTNQYLDALSASGTLDRPVLVAIATSKRSCSACRTWFKTLEEPAWAAWLKRHPMVLVLIDYASDRALYDAYHSLYKGDLADTWPTLAIVEPGSSPSDPDILAKLDEEDGKKSIYSDVEKFTDWLGEYVYDYESTTVSFGDPATNVLHEGEVFTGTVSRVGSDFGAVQATVRVTVDGETDAAYTQTFVWEDGESGVTNFVYAVDATEAYETPRQLQFLLSATNLAEGVSSVVTNTFDYSITNGISSIETNEVTMLVTTNYDVTATNRIEVTTNTVVTGAIALQYGTSTLDVSLLDQLEWQTFSQFKTENDAFDSLLSDSGTPWFVGGDGLLQTPPIGVGTNVSMTWRAPAAGYLCYHVQERESDSVTVTNTLSFRTASETNGWTTLTNNLTSAGGVEELPVLRVAVEEGDWLNFAFDTGAVTTSLAFAELSFTPFTNAVTQSSSEDDVIPFDEFAQDVSLLDFRWEEPDSLEDAYQRSISNRLFYTSVFSGNTVTGIVELGTATATNVCDAGIVVVDEAYAHGTLDCRLDWMADLSVFDFATRDAIWVPGVTRTFSFSTKPTFTEDAPAEGATLSAYLKVATSIAFTAASQRSVTYQVSGMPSGMTFDKTTGVLSGKPKKAGTYSITVTATSGGDSEVRTVILKVAKLPALLRNKAYGVLLDTAGEVCGTVELAVSSSAGFTAKFTLRDGRDKAASSLESETDGSFHAELPAKGFSAAMASSGLWSGQYGDFRFVARAVKGISFASVADTYTLNLFTPEESEKAGYGYLTAKLAKTGRARVKGVMPDAKSLSVSVYPIRATLNELTDAGLPVTAFTGFSAYGGDETLYLLPVFVKKAKQKFYALGAVGGNSASDRLWLEKAEYTGVSHWTLTASGYPFRKKQTGTFAGKALSVYRGDTLLFGDIPVTANFALSGAPASCSLKAVASGGVFSVKFRDGKKSVSAKAAAVTRDGTATGVGKSGKTLYYVMVE